MYMVLLLAGLVLTYLVWKSGNRVQDAIQSEAGARTSEARAEAERAHSEASTANQRVQELEQANLNVAGYCSHLRNPSG